MTDALNSEAAPGQGGGKAAPFVGLQAGAFTMLDEGLERALDLMQETAGVNAVFLYSHVYGGDVRKGLRVMAPDHGVPPKDNSNRKLPVVWVKHHDQYFKDTSLRHQVVDSSFEYANRDAFAELAEPCKKRGIKLYARILEGGGRSIANFDKCTTKTVYGRTTSTACWSHPDIQNFWAATAEDLFRSYQLDGFQWGAERMGPLMNVISPWNELAPTCFCEHCLKRGKDNGIDGERARKGFQELYEYVQALPNTKPPDGVFTGFLRLLLRYPEILSWEYQYRLAREEVQAGMFKKIKAIKPTADVGWHVDHQPSSWDIVYRSEMSYEEMAPHSDFIKIIAYHSVLGPRIRDWYLPRYKKTILSELTLEESLELYYELMGYDKNAEPKLNELKSKGFSHEYVERETQHSVASANGKVKIYTGIGFDVPGSPPENPDVIYQATLKAFGAGASGIVVSREWEEMRVPNLKAVGKAVKELAAK